MGFDSFISLMLACVGLLTLARREFGLFGRDLVGDMAWRVGILMMGAGGIGLFPISPDIWAVITYGTLIVVTIMWIIYGGKSSEQ